MGERILTVVVTTYNRPTLLNEALSSLERQHDRSFDVLIFDNGSTDSTPEIVQAYTSRNADWRSIRIDENWHSMKNVQCYADEVHTPWVTYLCDDDSFLPDYMTYALPALQSDNHGIICFGCLSSDDVGNILGSYTPREVAINAEDALVAWRTKLLPETAGITGFVFRTGLLRRITWDYPGGFFSDTRLVLEALSDGGVKAIPQCVVVRRVWSGSCSAVNPYSVLKRLTAHLQFAQDIGSKGGIYRIPSKHEWRLLRHPIAFFRNYGMALLDCESVPRTFYREWVHFALSCPLWLRLQCLALVAMCFMNRGILRRIQRTLRTWFCSTNRLGDSV